MRRFPSPRLMTAILATGVIIVGGLATMGVLTPTLRGAEPVFSGMLAPPATAAPRFQREPNLDRSGNDIKREVLAAGAALDACEALCLATTNCRAYTYVKQSTTVPAPICWLKDTVPQGYESSCCTSGVLKP